MSRHLFTVADVFLIPSRGVVLVPGIVPEGDELFRIGDPVLLKRPDGRSIETSIAGLDLFTRTAEPDVPVLLSGLSKEDVPIGTEVWSVSAAREAE